MSCANLNTRLAFLLFDAARNTWLPRTQDRREIRRRARWRVRGRAARPKVRRLIASLCWGPPPLARAHWCLNLWLPSTCTPMTLRSVSRPSYPSSWPENPRSSIRSPFGHDTSPIDRTRESLVRITKVGQIEAEMNRNEKQDTPFELGAWCNCFVRIVTEKSIRATRSGRRGVEWLGIKGTRCFSRCSIRRRAVCMNRNNSDLNADTLSFRITSLFI